MGNKSPYSADKSCIFRETFNSETAVTRNGGTLNGTTTFTDEYCKFVAANYVHPSISLYRRNKFSLRIIMKLDDISTSSIFIGQYLLDSTKRIAFAMNSTSHFCMLSDGINNCYINHTIALDTNWHEWIMVYNGSLTGNYNRLKLYRDGVYVTPSGQNQTIPATSPNYNTSFTIQHYSAGNIVNRSFKLLEIYNKALSAEEVKNLYNKNSYKDIKNGLILDIDARGGSIVDRCGNSLTMSGVAYKKDKVGVCAFDGTSQTGISCPVTVPTTNATINLWSKIYNTVTGTYYGIHMFFGKDSTHRFGIYNTSNGVYWDMPSNGFPSITRSRYLWNMYTMSINSSGSLNFYFNGIYVANVASGQAFPSTLYFGAYNNLYYRMKGCQNQQRIYNRVLTADEISQLYSYQKKNYE